MNDYQNKQRIHNRQKSKLVSVLYLLIAQRKV